MCFPHVLAQTFLCVFKNTDLNNICACFGFKAESEKNEEDKNW